MTKYKFRAFSVCGAWTALAENKSVYDFSRAFLPRLPLTPTFLRGFITLLPWVLEKASRCSNIGEHPRLFPLGVYLDRGRIQVLVVFISRHFLQ